MALRGPVSRRIYRIDDAEQVMVEPGDVAALIRTGWFEEARVDPR